jgi:hypothetical protein
MTIRPLFFTSLSFAGVVLVEVHPLRLRLIESPRQEHGNLHHWHPLVQFQSIFSAFATLFSNVTSHLQYRCRRGNERIPIVVECRPRTADDLRVSEVGLFQNIGLSRVPTLDAPDYALVCVKGLLCVKGLPEGLTAILALF